MNKTTITYFLMALIIIGAFGYMAMIRGYIWLCNGKDRVYKLIEKYLIQLYDYLLNVGLYKPTKTRRQGKQGIKDGNIYKIIIGDQKH